MGHDQRGQRVVQVVGGKVFGHCTQQFTAGAHDVEHVRDIAAPFGEHTQVPGVECGPVVVVGLLAGRHRQSH
jgi:hypothetical protein